MIFQAILVLKGIQKPPISNIVLEDLPRRSEDSTSKKYYLINPMKYLKYLNSTFRPNIHSK